MATTALDPSALSVMRLSSELLATQERVRHQQATIWALVTALRAERSASLALADLVDHLLGEREP
jgi:hypothetical protein